jgi:hypothetical protein
VYGGLKRLPFVFFWEGLPPQGQAARPLPQKTTTKTPRACLSQAPTKRGVCASLSAALLPVDATHVAAVLSTPADISAKPPPPSPEPHWRVTSNWPPSPCPLHGVTRHLPTPVEHTSAYQGGPAFVFFLGGRLIYTHSACSRRLHPDEAARPAPMSRTAHAVESKAVVRIKVAVSPHPCLGCAVELALRVAPLRRGVPPR